MCKYDYTPDHLNSIVDKTDAAVSRLSIMTMNISIEGQLIIKKLITSRLNDVNIGRLDNCFISN